ncbi:AmiR/NasT family two-component response regulator [Methylobacterium sp. PvP062]|jgi:AmiR/NasT family two-component response regulator|uniref:Response regulator receiver and ANTAR domain protein n=2 Tax=Methylobacterium radiotolerans TaxID=31998 RepID=B1LSJ9_METRJ|nr:MULTISPECIES: ANTAR domain-containing protein [Methylobacterium]MCX7334258.1 ANTAR domain-containing protein [Hyphomicrobiales bacterium]ACB25301.1 response regulator receiver and ANTAR domain protein [Methylobacterium radiotolerans JCM 2831]KZC01855.1 Aliphatic amidase regulator [Methylobacterium radiotolerans]MBP2496307.1 AmiR/NasT family two-component response regulator [Methylobacterium sp. PvP105]MBP2503822.1 AmiR/NasT family two-component response regulator [Methylobacterium sp. PvP10
MTTPRLIQNFSGAQALLIAPPSTATDVLASTLMKLGLTVASVVPAGEAPWLDLESLDPEHHIVVVDGDLPLPGLAASAVPDLPPVPVVGLVGVEAPSRLKGLLQLGATGLLRKPIHGASVYAALFLAVNEHNRRRLLEERIARHEERRRGRRHVVKAILRLMQEHGLDDDAAYEALRRDAMRARQPLEAYCEALVRARPSVTAPAAAPRLARS